MSQTYGSHTSLFSLFQSISPARSYATCLKERLSQILQSRTSRSRSSMIAQISVLVTKRTRPNLDYIFGLLLLSREKLFSCRITVLTTIRTMRNKVWSPSRNAWPNSWGHHVTSQRVSYRNGGRRSCWMHTQCLTLLQNRPLVVIWNKCSQTRMWKARTQIYIVPFQKQKNTRCCIRKALQLRNDSRNANVMFKS